MGFLDNLMEVGAMMWNCVNTILDMPFPMLPFLTFGELILVSCIVFIVFAFIFKLFLD